MNDQERYDKLLGHTTALCCAVSVLLQNHPDRALLEKYFDEQLQDAGNWVLPLPIHETFYTGMDEIKQHLTR